jgi:hypothetical protein
MILLFSCSEFTVQQKPESTVPVAEPPGEESSFQGEVPDWETCNSGFFGRYFNLSIQDPVVEASSPGWLAEPAWGEAVFTQYDPSLDMGAGWWPVDEGLEADPLYFAVRWYGWLRVREEGAVPFLAGAINDLGIWLGEEQVIGIEESDIFEPQTYTLSLDAGVYPIEVRFAQRIGEDSGLRVRLLLDSDQAQLCYPDYRE